jgi:hypothetical protein
MLIEYALKINDRNKWCSPSKFTGIANRLLSSRRVELYRSLFIYPKEEVQLHLKKYQTIAQYAGNVLPDHVLIDIDREGRIDLALEQVKKLVNRFHYELDIPFEAFLVYFSGSKGFHIVLHRDLFHLRKSTTLNKVVHALVKEQLCQGFEVDSIYDKTRLVRAVGSQNKKSGYFKIPLTQEELHTFDIGQIVTLAKQPRKEFDYSAFMDTSFEPVLQTEIAEIRSHVNREIVNSKLGGFEATLDPMLENTRKITCIHKIVQAGPQQGGRHTQLGVIASSFRRQGIPMIVTQSFLTAWFTGHKGYDSGRVADQVKSYYVKGYRPSCTGENPMSRLMQAHCDEQCMFFRGKDLNRGLMSMDESLPLMEERLRLIRDKKYIDLGLILSGKPSKIWIMPSMLITILAPTSVGKTAFIQWLQFQLGMPVNYLSLEMDMQSMLMRYGQMIFGLGVNEFADWYLDPKNDAKNKMAPYIQHLNTTLNSMTVLELWDMMEQDNVPSVVIDHIGLLKTLKRDERGKTKEITAELRKMAVQRQYIIWAISHVRRSDARENEVGIYSGVESGSIENDSHLVLAIQGDKDESYREIEILKNTMGPTGEKFPMMFDQNTYRWTPTTRRTT